MQGEKDWEKYEVARKLKSCVDNIRNQYCSDLKSRQMSTRQRAVALYFIDKVCVIDQDILSHLHQSAKNEALGNEV